MTFWAHSDASGLAPGQPGSRWQSLSEHLTNVATLARQLAAFAAPDYAHLHDVAECCGLLHDYGKYTRCFQRMITGEGKGPCPHSIYGAALAYEALKAPHVASAIAGHHAGMPDLGELADRVGESKVDAFRLLGRASNDLGAISRLVESAPPFEKIGKRFDLFTRMLLSCLVDADRLDTAGREMAQAPLMAEERLAVLSEHLKNLESRGIDGVVKSARRLVLEDCLAAAHMPGPIFSLSVPTGGGKTLSAMAFALKRAALQPERFRRIIVVIPYLSIIEQNAAVYARVFGEDAILEHHSGSFAALRTKGEHFQPVPEGSEDFQPSNRRAETENWDAPLIVTTSVRFFESLFSNHPSDLRRVHNIARSIVILDEVQVLPHNLVAPLLSMVDELCRDWGCSFVLATATKPAFERRDEQNTKDLRWPAGTVREIIAAPEDLHNKLQRVSIEWRIRDSAGWPEVAGWMQEQSQCLCVVNLRDHALALYEELCGRVPVGSLFHLSTRMCAAHRLDVLAIIKHRLREGLGCMVVSTQLIEAGVDVDFPTAFRALGPLDSIVQVAGRADREGKLSAAVGRPGGKLVVFKPVDHRTPPNEYETATALTEVMARQRDLQPNDLGAMAEYFDTYYAYGDLGSSLVEMRARGRFRTLADEFEMISSRTQDVFVPYGDGIGLIEELCAMRRVTSQLRRRLQRFTVGLQPWDFKAAEGAAIWQLADAGNVWIANQMAYSEVTGLQTSISSGPLIV